MQGFADDNGDQRGTMVRAGTTVRAKIAAPTQLDPVARTGSCGAKARSSSPTHSPPSRNSTPSATAKAKTNTVAAQRTRKMVRVIKSSLVPQGLALETPGL